MSGVNRNRSLAYSELVKVLRETRDEFPSFKITRKADSKLMKVLDVFLRVVTFNQMKSFMDRYTTTIGYTIYVSSSWINKTPYSKASILRHERVHMRQRRRMGLVKYSLYYLLAWFPIGLAAGRRNLEMEAYAESLQSYADYYGLPNLKDGTTRENVIGEFTGPSYFWMWPFRKTIERWYDATVQRIIERVAVRIVSGEER